MLPKDIDLQLLNTHAGQSFSKIIKRNFYFYIEKTTYVPLQIRLKSFKREFPATSVIWRRNSVKIYSQPGSEYILTEFC